MVTEFGICVARCVERHNWLAHVALLLKIKSTSPCVLANANPPSSFPLWPLQGPAWPGGRGEHLPSDLCTQHCPLPSTEDLISPFLGRCRGPCHFSSPLSRLTPPRHEKGKCDPALRGKRRPYEWRPGVTRSGVTALGATAVLPLPPPWRRLGGRHSESATERRTKADPRATRSLAGLGRRQPPTEGADTGAGARRSAGFHRLRVRPAMLLSQHEFEAPGF